MNYQLPWPVYVFLGIIALLLFLAGVKIFGIYVQIQRRRRMVQEAVRNGTYVPPTPPNLTIKPELWEAYLGLGESGWPQLKSSSSIDHDGSGDGEKELLDTNWKSEYSRDWESIKPLYAGFAKPVVRRVVYSCSPPNLPTSVTPPPPSITPINHFAPSRGDDEENQRTAVVSTTTTPSLLARARRFLNLDSTTAAQAAVPASSSANNNETNSHPISTMSHSNSPQPMIRVVVLIAMPSPTPSSSSHVSTTTTRPLSATPSVSLSSETLPTNTSHAPSPSSPTTTLRFTDDEEYYSRIPHLEMGVADVVVVRSTTKDSESSSWDSSALVEEKSNHSRGSSYAEP